MVNWSDQISRFEPLVVEAVPIFASPTEMEQAVTTYNRALAQLWQDSRDIALIALRKLASSYPLFPHPAFLLGCLLADSGRLKEAGRLIQQALSVGLPQNLDEDAKSCLAYMQTRQPDQPADVVQTRSRSLTEREPPALNVTQILEKTRRGKKVRMAGKKEQRTVMRGHSYPEETETKVRMRKDPVALLRTGLPILAVVLVVATLILAGIRWLPALWRPKPQLANDTQKLSWLLARLDQLSAEDAQAAGLLAEYEAVFAAEASAGTSEVSGQTTSIPVQTTSSETTVLPTATPLPTKPLPTPSPTAAPTPTPDPAVLAFREAVTALAEAEAHIHDDLVTSGLALAKARSLLAGIPGTTTAVDVDGDAATLSQNVEMLISEIAVSAANALRLKAQPLFQEESYTEALVYYQAAYDLYPRAYGGGVAYYVGRCHQLLGEPQKAKPYYDFVIEQFSGRDIAKSAAYRIREMG